MFGNDTISLENLANKRDKNFFDFLSPHPFDAMDAKTDF